ncbi:MAG: hypothetical protein DWQ08_10220 [Proteobacteria bacterium]|nr:MAG: hypothetical protein DWQ08_10220 [Pseudomonadota bacterium]
MRVDVELSFERRSAAPYTVLSGVNLTAGSAIVEAMGDAATSSSAVLPRVGQFDQARDERSAESRVTPPDISTMRTTSTNEKK